LSLAFDEVSEFVCIHLIEVAGLPMLMLVNVPPVLRPTVLQPEDRSSCVGRNVLDIGCVNRLGRIRRHEDFDRFVLEADGLVVKASDHALVSSLLADL